MRAVIAASDLMLATVCRAPFSDPDWLFEWKYDGYRVLIRKADHVEIISRLGNVLNASFPDIVEAVSAVPGQFVWDAELTVDTEGIPSFDRLKRRAKTTSARSIPTMVRRHPARLYVFDLLATDEDVRRRPLTERKSLLRDTFEDTETLVYVAGAVGAGNEVFALARQYGFEGMVAKRLASTYQRGRSRDWLKVRDAGYRRI